MARSTTFALIVLFLVQLVVSRQRLLIGALAFFGALLFVVIPSDAQRRLFLIFSQSVASADDRGAGGLGEAAASSAHRQHLLTRAMEMTVQNPLFGIGQAQFPNVIWSEGKAGGVHEAALGTHNSYAQISSETGIPAFFCYVSMIVMSIRRNFRIYKFASRFPELNDLGAQSFCWFSATVAYMVFSTFHHIAYSNLLPILCGGAIAMELLSRPYLQHYLPSTPPIGGMRPPSPMPQRAIVTP